LVAFAQDFRRHAELADVVQRRGDHQHLGDLGLRAGGEREQLAYWPRRIDAVPGPPRSRGIPWRATGGGFSCTRVCSSCAVRSPHQALELLAPPDSAIWLRRRALSTAALIGLVT